MKIYEVHQAGSFALDTTGKPIPEFDSLLGQLASIYADANLALHLYQEVRIILGKVREQEDASDYSEEGYQPVYFVGEMPISMVNRSLFMHARSFLYALDTFHELVKKLEAQPSSPSGIANILAAFAQHFPGLRDVRNSAHHVEDRVLGLGTRGRPIDIKAINDYSIDAPAKSLLLTDFLSGNNYGGTAADGTVKTVEVSATSMSTLQGLFQQLLSYFNWRNPHASTLPL
jgi:hypothetical protein